MSALREVQRGGARLVLEDAGTGPACVFQHGLGGNRAQAAQNFPEGADWRRLTLECRAHGGSEPGAERPFSIAMFTGDVLAIAQVAGVSRFIAGGVSMGAAIALRLAHLDRQAARALVLVRPAWGWEPAPANMRPYALAAEAMRRFPQDREAARRRFAGSDEAQRLARAAPDNLASLLGFFDRPDLDSTADLLGQIAADGPGVSREEIAALRCPTLVVGNEEDAVHPASLARALADLIPSARFVMAPPKAVDGPAHQAAVRAAIADFLSALSFEPSRETIR